jgi:DNA-binding MurR/RpiR family transcriptional regulator
MNQELRNEIRQNLDEYSRIQKKLAVFLVEYWNEIPLMSIEYISQETGVSMATIIRFVRKFNFKGFYEFKEKIKADIKNNINPVERFRLLKPDFSGKQSLVKLAKQDVKNINKLLSMVKEEAFRKLVDMIEQSRRIFTFGVSISSIFARMITYIFNQIRKETHCLDEGCMTVEERILSIQKDDLVIFSSFYPYSRCTVEFAQLAHQEGLRVVGISDNEYSPISQYASLMLAIPSENVLFTTSLSAFSVLINAVATEIAVKKKDELSDTIKLTDKKLRKFYYLS